jgi:hypothetical protein
MSTLSLRNSLAAALLVCAVANASPAQAVANPAAIDWDAPPTAFVTSLYWGVLGRAPESAAVVGGWAANVTSNPSSRLTVLSGFVNSPEYRGRFGEPSGQWSVNYMIEGNTVRWMASTNPNGWFTQHNGLSSGYARALVGYYDTYASRR